MPLFIAALVAIALSFVGAHLPALAHRGVPVTATVTAKQPQNHSSVVYEYRVEGAAYSGRSSVPDLDDVRIGDSVAVTFVRDQPWISIVGDARRAYHDWIHVLTVVPLSVALIPMTSALLVEFTRSHLTNRSRQPLPGA